LKKEIRPVISAETYEQVTKLVDLHIQIGFDKSLNVILQRYAELEKFYKKNVNVEIALPSPPHTNGSPNKQGNHSL
jgi:hypothetical protein